MLLHYCLVVCCWFEFLLLHSFTRVEIHDLVEEILTEIWGLTCNGRSPRPIGSKDLRDESHVISKFQPRCIIPVWGTFLYYRSILLL